MFFGPPRRSDLPKGCIRGGVVDIFVTPMTSTPLRREPRQQRSQVLVQSLLDATCQILEREGPSALNTNYIAEVAGVSIGSLYQYFDGKDAVVEAVFLAQEQRSLDERKQWAAEALDLDLEGMLRLFIERIAGQHRRFLEMHEGLYRQHQGHTDVRRLADQITPLTGAGKHPVEAFLHVWCKRHRDEIREVNLDHAAFLLDRAGYAIMRSTVDERPEFLKSPEYVEEMVQMLVRYLRA